MEDISSQIPVTAEELEYVAALIGNVNQDPSIGCDCPRMFGVNTNNGGRHDCASVDLEEDAQHLSDIYQSELSHAENGEWDTFDEAEEASAYLEHEDALDAQDIETADNAAAEEVDEALVTEHFASHRRGGIVRECGCASKIGVDEDGYTIHYHTHGTSYQEDIYKSELALAESGTWDMPAH